MLTARKKLPNGLGMAVLAFNASTWRLRQEESWEFDARLGCTVSSRLARMTQKTVSKSQKLPVFHSHLCSLAL